MSTLNLSRARTFLAAALAVFAGAGAHAAVRPVCATCTYSSVASAMLTATAADVIELRGDIVESYSLTRTVAEIRSDNNARVWSVNTGTSILDINMDGIDNNFTTMNVRGIVFRNQSASGVNCVNAWNVYNAPGAGIAFFDCTFWKSSGTTGAAVDINGPINFGNSFRIERCVFRGTGSTGSSGLFVSGQSQFGVVALRNDVFFGFGGGWGVNLSDSDSDAIGFVENCTLSGFNVGIACGSGSAVTNCILANNVQDLDFYGSASTTANVSYSAFETQPNFGGSGNLFGISSAAQFVNEGAFDFRVRDTSSAIYNAATTLPFVSVDILGTARPQGASPDIGAYELIVGTPTFTPTPTRTASPSPTATPSPVPGDGLSVSYFDDIGFQPLMQCQVEPQINFTWGVEAPPVPAMSVGTVWTLRAEGSVRPSNSEVYTFYVTTDDGARLWVNGQLLVNAWYAQGATEHYGYVTLTAGIPVPVKLEFFQGLGAQALQLRWSSPSVGKQLIPQANLYSVACGAFTATPSPTPIPAGTPQADPLSDSSLAAFWTAKDIGGPVAPGSQAEASSLSVTAVGCDIWGYADQFRFVFQPVAGDFDVTLRVNSVPLNGAWTKAGLMLRASESEFSPWVFMMATRDNGFAMQARTGTAQDAIMVSNAGTYAPPNGWVRLKREGGLVFGYRSTDGAAWTLADALMLPELPSNALLGIAVTSGDCNAAGSASFNDFAVLPTSSPTPVATATPTPPGAAPVYREVFPNGSSPLATQDLLGANWHVYRGAACAYVSATVANGYIVSVSAGKPTNEPAVNSFAGTTETALGVVSDNNASNGMPTLFYTRERVIDLSGSLLSEVRWTQGNENYSTTVRVALEVGGAWFVSEQVFQNGALAGVATFNSLATVMSLGMGAATWRSLTVAQGVSLALGGGATLPAGTVTGFGLFCDSPTNTVRFDNYAIFAAAFTPTPTFTYSRTPTPSATPTPSRSSTNTPSITPTWSRTSTVTPTWSHTSTATPSWSHTSTATPTFSRTPTITPSSTLTSSATPTPSQTPTPSPSETSTTSPTATPSSSATLSATPSRSRTSTPTLSSTPTPSASPSFTRTPTASSTSTPTPTASSTPTPTPTSTPSLTATASATASATPSPTRTSTATPTPSATPSASGTASATPTLTRSATPSASPSITPTYSPSPTFSVSPTPASPTPTPDLSVRVTLRLLDGAGLEVRLVQGLSASHVLASPSVPAGPYDPSQGPLVISDGDFSYALDGKDADGRALRSGVYVLEVVSEASGAASTKALTVEITGRAGGGLSVRAVPNPATAKALAVAIVWAPRATVDLRIYNGAGDLVRQMGSLSSGRVEWDLRSDGGQPAANGVYLLTLKRPEERLPTVFKLVLTR